MGGAGVGWAWGHSVIVPGFTPSMHPDSTAEADYLHDWGSENPPPVGTESAVEEGEEGNTW